MCGFGEALQLGIGERGGDEQNGVGAMGAGFDDLVLVDHEVLAQAGQRRGSRGQLEVAQAALKVGLVGEHGKRGSSAGAIAAGEPGRVEVGADQAFGGGGFLDFGDDRGAGGGLAAQGAAQPRGRWAARRSSSASGHTFLGRCHGGARGGQNGGQNVSEWVDMFWVEYTGKGGFV